MLIIIKLIYISLKKRHTKIEEQLYEWLQTSEISNVMFTKMLK